MQIEWILLRPYSQQGFAHPGKALFAAPIFIARLLVFCTFSDGGCGGAVRVDTFTVHGLRRSS